MIFAMSMTKKLDVHQFQQIGGLLALTSVGLWQTWLPCTLYLVKNKLFLYFQRQTGKVKHEPTEKEIVKAKLAIKGVLDLLEHLRKQAIEQIG